MRQSTVVYREYLMFYYGSTIIRSFQVISISKEDNNPVFLGRSVNLILIISSFFDFLVLTTQWKPAFFHVCTNLNHEVELRNVEDYLIVAGMMEN